MDLDRVIDDPLRETAAALASLLMRLPDPDTGAQVEQLETELAATFGVRHAVAVASGTAALHCALAACGVGAGDEVLVPAVSVVMSVAPIVFVGAKPVFVDCDETGADFNYVDLGSKVTSRTRAVLSVYLWGRSGDPQRLTAFAAERGLRFIEDACQAHGSRFAGRGLGTFGDAGCFSLRDGKILWSGEGGFILSNDAAVAAYCRAYRTHWQMPPAGERPMSRLGHNYRLAEPLAVIARGNLARFDELVGRRRQQSSLLTSLIMGLPGFTIPIPRPEEEWNGYAPLIQLDMPDSRAFSERLAAIGVPNSVGTFRLVASDQRLLFAPYSPSPCPRAKAYIDSMLAIVVSERNSDHDIERYAEILLQEMNAWPGT
jgi:perosamine synthetase